MGEREVKEGVTFFLGNGVYVMGSCRAVSLSCMPQIFLLVIPILLIVYGVVYLNYI